MMLQCQDCGNVYAESLKRRIGTICGVAFCTGVLKHYPSAQDLAKCPSCGGIFGPPKKVYDLCPVCTKTVSLLVAYR
jgi:hypothetical protein